MHTIRLEKILWKVSGFAFISLAVVHIALR
jgi:hypothetical protein